MMELLGYSERGVLNALLYGIRYAPHSEELLRDLLSLTHFPHRPEELPSTIDAAQVLVEQSFSDFGDADALFLLDAPDRRSAVFLEAKVRTVQAHAWNVAHEYARFVAGVGAGKVSRSNLFAQLYLKQRLVGGLRACSGVSACRAHLAPCFEKVERKIGKNEIVLRAAECVRHHLDDARYLALIPGGHDAVATFFTQVLPAAGSLGLAEWDTSSWGYLLWDDVEAFCARQGLRDTLAVFAHNAGAIT